MIFSRQINHFMSIVKSGSFLSAAEKNSITPSAISRSILELERMLGDTLFIRRKNETVLTKKGSLFWKEISPYYHKLNSLPDMLFKAGGKNMKLTISVDDIFYPRMIHIVSGLICQNDKVDVHVLPARNENFMSTIITGGIDFHITTKKANETFNNKKIHRIALGVELIGLIMKRAPKGENTNVDFLLKNNKLIQKWSVFEHEAYLQLKKNYLDKDIDFNEVAVQDVSEVCHLVSAGKGVSFMSSEMLKHPLLVDADVHFIQLPFESTLQRYIYFSEERFDELIDIATLIKINSQNNIDQLYFK